MTGVVVSITAFLKSKVNRRLTPQYSTLTYAEKQRISEDGRKEANMKKVSSWKKRKQHHTVKVLTFKPQANGWYKCNQTGKPKRQSQILSHMMEAIHNNKTTIIRRG